MAAVHDISHIVWDHKEYGHQATFERMNNQFESEHVGKIDASKENQLLQEFKNAHTPDLFKDTMRDESFLDHLTKFKADYKRKLDAGKDLGGLDTYMHRAQYKLRNTYKSSYNPLPYKNKKRSWSALFLNLI